MINVLVFKLNITQKDTNRYIQQLSIYYYDL